MTFARIIRRLCVPIALAWLALAALTNASVPLLEKVAEEHNVALSAQDAPSMIAMRHIGKVFNEFNSDSAAMIVLEGDEPLGAQAHAYYDTLIAKLSADTKHVQHVQNFWGDPLTAAGSQSRDGKAAYSQVYLAGNQGEGLSDESVRAVREIVAETPPPADAHPDLEGLLAKAEQHASEMGNGDAHKRGGLGFVEAGLTATLALAGVGASEAVIATFAYRLMTYWLPLPLGLAGIALHQRHKPDRAET